MGRTRPAVYIEDGGARWSKSSLVIKVWRSAVVKKNTKINDGEDADNKL